MSSSCDQTTSNTESVEQQPKLEHIIKKRPAKGSQCSVEGNKYERKIHNILKDCSIDGKPFNTQKENELAGSSSKNDIECDFITERDIGIEVKKYKTPDWMQSSIKYNSETKSWEASERSRNPPECREMFNKIINKMDLFDGEVPPFVERRLTYDEWVKIKKSEPEKWCDKYMDIPVDYISKLYSAKGCKYIQISDGYGLYHLGDDVCKFNVPLFHIEQQLRVRVKIHKRKNKKGFCDLSITIACQPKNITKFDKSNYSLDDENKLPVSLIYKS